MSMWKKALKAVDWDSLQHAYGSARNVPTLIEKMAAGDEEALDELEYSVLHQGGLCAAAVPTVEVAVAMIADGLPPEPPLTLIQSAAKAVVENPSSTAQDMRSVLLASYPVLAALISAGGDEVVAAAEVVSLIGPPTPELTDALISALEDHGDLAWAAAVALGHHGLFPGSDDPRLAVPAALGRFAAGTATDQDVALVATHQVLVEEHEFVAWLGDVPRGPELLAAFEPTESVMIGLLDAADRRRSATCDAIRQVLAGTRDDTLPAEDAITLLLRLPRTPEVLDALDGAASRFDGPVEGWTHPRASVAHALAVAGDPRWENHLAATLRWGLEQGEDLADEDLNVAIEPQIGAPIGSAFQEADVVPGEILAQVVAEYLTTREPDDEFTGRTLAEWIATWPDDLQGPLRAVAKRWDPANPHWADTEADLQAARAAAENTDDLIRLARHTGEVTDWERALEACGPNHDQALDDGFPQRDHPQLIAWWQGLLADEDSDEDVTVACVKGLVDAGVLPVRQAWPRIVDLLVVENFYAGKAARLAAEWIGRIDDAQRAELVTRLGALIREAEYDRAVCGSVLLGLGEPWPLSAEETVDLVARELRDGWTPGLEVELCGLLREREPGIAEQVLLGLRSLLDDDRRLAPSIREDEEKQATLRRCLGLLEQG
ncbi:hypothetical protein [Arachnia propionica]|uniref:Uncharacterized protein n=1 Tax=Arachnia propionica TaxID=1750 RepID=A0A3P1WSC5_9ACTN|nr:hypothetical protein [Arachnia propionica]RRD48866.1 hypothetical protein EII35_10945 [Arachnia propionica]